MQIEIVEMPSRTLYGARHVGPYNQIGEAFGRMEQEVQRLGLHPAAVVAVFHDDPSTTPADQLRSDAACELHESSASFAEALTRLTLPEGRYARWVYIGPYSGLPDAWRDGIRSMITLGLTPEGVCYEEYLNDPCNTPAEALKTILFQQVRRGEA